MATFFMFGKYSSDSVQKITADRTNKTSEVIKKCGGEVKEIYALLGQYDLVLITDFPGNKEAVKASLAVARATGIAWTTSPAFSAQEFDKLATES